MISLLVSDIDGTLVLPENHIEEHVLLELKKYQANGNGIVLATGRNFQSVKRLLDLHELKVNGIALLNGAILLDEKLQIVKEAEIGIAILSDIMKATKDRNDTKVYIVTNLREEEYKTNLTLTENEKLYSVNIEIDSEDIDILEELCETINEISNNLVSVFRNKNFIDIAPFGCSKGKAANYFKKQLKVSGNMYCIGDSWNDVSMIKESAYGTTFHSAEPLLKEEASFTVEDIFEYLNFIQNKEKEYGYE